jgi:predicted HicB family RNase H-like nuclease
MIKKTIIMPDEASKLWKQAKAQAALEGKSVGNWVLDAIKQAL